MSGWITGILGVIGTGASVYGTLAGANAANDAVPQLSDYPVAGYDPAADPLLALLRAQASAQLGFAPDRQILAAAAPINRLENALIGSLSGTVKNENLRTLNNIITTALGSIASQIAAGETNPDVIATVLQGVTNSTLSQDEQRRVAEGLQARPGSTVGVLESAYTSAGFNNLQDLVTQQLAYQEKANTAQAGFASDAESRAAARSSANLSIDRLLTDYPAYGASDFARESMLALQPYQAQELEQANVGGYNPATNIALTRTNGIRDALAILSGRQGLANTSLTALQTALGIQTNEALAVSGQSQAAQANAASLASQQALALSGLSLQSGMYQGNNTGSAYAGAGALIGNAISGLNQPGTAPRSPQSQPQSQEDFLSGLGAQYPWLIGST